MKAAKYDGDQGKVKEVPANQNLLSSISQFERFLRYVDPTSNDEALMIDYFSRRSDNPSDVEEDVDDPTRRSSIESTQEILNNPPFIQMNQENSDCVTPHQQNPQNYSQQIHHGQTWQGMPNQEAAPNQNTWMTSRQNFLGSSNQSWHNYNAGQTPMQNSSFENWRSVMPTQTLPIQTPTNQSWETSRQHTPNNSWDAALQFYWAQQELMRAPQQAMNQIQRPPFFQSIPASIPFNSTPWSQQQQQQPDSRQHHGWTVNCPSTQTSLSNSEYTLPPPPKYTAPARMMSQDHLNRNRPEAENDQPSVNMLQNQKPTERPPFFQSIPASIPFNSTPWSQQQQQQPDSRQHHGWTVNCPSTQTSLSNSEYTLPPPPKYTAPERMMSQDHLNRNRTEAENAQPSVNMLQNQKPTKTCCCFHVNGCFEVFENEILKQKHEQDCLFRNVKCPFETCTWTGILCTMALHIRNCHADEVATGSTCRYMILVPKLGEKCVVRFVQSSQNVLFVIEVFREGQNIYSACQFIPETYHIKTCAIGTLKMESVPEQKILKKLHLNIPRYPSPFIIPGECLGSEVSCLSVPLRHVQCNHVVLDVMLSVNTDTCKKHWDVENRGEKVPKKIRKVPIKIPKFPKNIQKGDGKKPQKKQQQKNSENIDRQPQIIENSELQEETLKETSDEMEHV